MADASTPKTFLVAILVAFCCAALLSLTAVGLADRVQANRDRELMNNVLLAAGLEEPEAVDVRIVELDTGGYVSSADVGIGTYDQRQAAADLDLSDAIPEDEDLAHIGRREKYSYVGLIYDGGQLDQLILPVRGAGYGGILYGFVVLDGDLATVRNIQFIEHSETPGLGAEVTNPVWRARWSGKRIYDDAGRVRIELVRAGVDPGREAAVHQVDALSGATVTSEGVTSLMRYWFGERGFAPFLEKLRSERGEHG
jgi:Na+-transporting NADH:ubiquinone oxidoreductase subunit C